MRLICPKYATNYHLHHLTVPDAVQCSNDIVWDLFSKTFNQTFPARECSCWESYRKGGCKNNEKAFLTFIGLNTNIDLAKLKENPRKFYLRTNKSADSIGDTSALSGHQLDFPDDVLTYPNCQPSNSKFKLFLCTDIFEQIFDCRKIQRDICKTKQCL